MAKKRAPHSVDPAEIEKNAENLPQLTFAKILNRLMEERGIDQEKMSADLRMSTGLIHNYRHGKTEPKLSAIIKIAEYLDIDCHYLLTGISPDNRKINKALNLSEEAISRILWINDSKTWPKIKNLDALICARSIVFVMDYLETIALESKALKLIIEKRKNEILMALESKDSSKISSVLSSVLDDDTIYDKEKNLRYSVFELSEVVKDIANETSGFRDVEKDLYELRELCFNIENEYEFDCPASE